MTVGGQVEIEVVSPTKPAPFDPARPERPDLPSLRADTVDRAHWSLRPFYVPVDGVTHRPAYTDGFQYVDATRRQRGEYPTEFSSVDTTVPGSQTQILAESFGAPFITARDLVMAIPRAMTSPPWSEVQSPASPRERYNYPDPVGVTYSAIRVERPPPKPGDPPLPPMPAELPPTIWIFKDGKWIQVPRP